MTFIGLLELNLGIWTVILVGIIVLIKQKKEKVNVND